MTRTCTYHITNEDIREEYMLVLNSQNDPHNFDTLYKKYFGIIFNYIYRRTDDEDITSDLCSQTFLQALVNIRKFTFKGVPFSAWLYRIATHEIYRHYRLHQRKVNFSFEEEMMDACVEYEGAGTHGAAEAVVQHMQQLETRDVEILQLRFMEMKSFAEISYMMDVSEASAKMRCYRAIDKLKRLMA